MVAAAGTYRIDFMMSGDPNDPTAASSPNNTTLTVTVKGFPLLANNTLLNAEAFSFDTSAAGKANTLANMMWTPMETSEFTSTGDFRVIFASTTKGLYGPAITDVQVVSSNVPEQRSIVLLGSGLVGLACLRTRRTARGRQTMLHARTILRLPGLPQSTAG